MPPHALNLFIDAGALMAFSPGLNHAVHQDHQNLHLYAQLAADNRLSRSADPLAWHDLYIAALKRFGLCLPCIGHRWFEADVTQARTLAHWLAPPATTDIDEPAWPVMVQAMQQLASATGGDLARQLLHTHAVTHATECSSLNLLLVHVATDATVDLWFARLQTRELIERNLFDQVFTGSALLGRVEVFHHAGMLGEDYMTHRAMLAGQLGTRRQDLLLAVAADARRQP